MSLSFLFSPCYINLDIRSLTHSSISPFPPFLSLSYFPYFRKFYFVSLFSFISWYTYFFFISLKQQIFFLLFFFSLLLKTDETWRETTKHTSHLSRVKAEYASCRIPVTNKRIVNMDHYETYLEEEEEEEEEEEKK